MYYSTDGGSILDKNQRDKMLANFMAPSTLSLRVNAQVMLIKNMDETLVNGSMGKILRFADPNHYAAEIAGELPKDGKKLPAAAGGVSWPVVEFLVPGGRREVIIQPEAWKVELPNGEVQCSRTQVSPNLIPGYQRSKGVFFAVAAYLGLGHVYP